MGLSVVCPDAAAASRGYETGTFSDERALAGTCDPCRGKAGQVIAPRSQKTPANGGSISQRWPTSFAREEVSGIAALLFPDRRPVTPEVAGSSPVAPAKIPANHIFCCPSGSNRP